MKTDTTERGLESLIMRHMTGTDGLPSGAEGVVADAAPAKSGSGCWREMMRLMTGSLRWIRNSSSFS